MIAAKGLEFFRSSWVNAPIIQFLCKETVLYTPDETEMKFGLLHSVLFAPARKRVGSYRGCSPDRAEITLGHVPCHSSASMILGHLF